MIRLPAEYHRRNVNVALPWRYRLMMFDRPLAPWRRTQKEALDDARDRRLGAEDEHRGYLLTVPAWIWQERATGVTDRGLRPRETPRLTEVADLAAAPLVRTRYVDGSGPRREARS